MCSKIFSEILHFHVKNLAILSDPLGALFPVHANACIAASYGSVLALSIPGGQQTQNMPSSSISVLHLLLHLSLCYSHCHCTVPKLFQVKGEKSSSPVPPPFSFQRDFLSHFSPSPTSFSFPVVCLGVKMGHLSSDSRMPG